MGFLPRQCFFGWFVSRDVGTGRQCGVIPFSFRNLICFSIHAKTHFLVARETKLRFPLWTVYCPQKNCECFLFANENSARNTPFFLDRLKRLLVVQIPGNIVYQENAEHLRLMGFHWQSETVEMGGTCLGEQKSIQSKVVFNSWKLYYYTEDTFTRNCIQGFSDIQRNEKVLL